jgi:hypothetical protein
MYINLNDKVIEYFEPHGEYVDNETDYYKRHMEMINYFANKLNCRLIFNSTQKQEQSNNCLVFGTWFGLMKVNNDEIWNDYVKTGKVKGFSIDGVFDMEKVNLKTEINNNLWLVTKLGLQQLVYYITTKN